MGIQDTILKEAAKKSAEAAMSSFADVGVQNMVPMMEKLRTNLIMAMKGPKFAKLPPQVKSQLKHELVELGKLASHVPGVKGGKKHRKKTLKKKSKKGRKKTHKKH